MFLGQAAALAVFAYKFGNVGVERVFPLYSALVDSITVKRRGDVRRAKLYYLRELSGRAARIREKLPQKK